MMKCNNGELLQLVEESIARAEELAMSEVELAKSHLDNLDDSFAKSKLEALGDFIINRTK